MVSKEKIDMMNLEDEFTSYKSFLNTTALAYNIAHNLSKANFDEKSIFSIIEETLENFQLNPEVFS